MLPEYCCAVIEDRRGWLILQLRPATATFAAGQLTCFGGRRNDDEGVEDCLRRELREELAWSPQSLRACCELRDGRRFIAAFFRCSAAVAPLRAIEPGQIAIRAPWATLPGLPLSPWHRRVLDAIRRGAAAVDLAGT